MATSPERLKILKLIQEGKISAEEGIELLDMITGETAPATEPNPTPKSLPQWFRVVVTDTNTGKIRVNVRLPISLVSAGMKMGAKFSPHVEGLDQGKLAELIHSGATGKVIDLYDDQDGEQVEVIIE